VLNVLLEAENSPLFEVDRLVDASAEDLGVVEGAGRLLRRAAWIGMRVVLVDTGSLEDLCLDGVGLEADFKIPLLDLFRI
jgi:hypothetical protein